MIELDIQSPSLDRLRRRYAEAPGIVQQELRAGMEVALKAVQEEVRARTPVRTGRLRESIVRRFERVNGPELEGAVVSVPLPGQPARLALWMNDGTRPHVINARRGKVLRFTGRSGEPVFRRRVRHPGTRALHFFERGMEAALPQVRRIFSARLGNVTKRLRVP